MPLPIAPVDPTITEDSLRDNPAVTRAVALVIRARIYYWPHQPFALSDHTEINRIARLLSAMHALNRQDVRTAGSELNDPDAWLHNLYYLADIEARRIAEDFAGTLPLLAGHPLTDRAKFIFAWIVRLTRTIRYLRHNLAPGDTSKDEAIKLAVETIGGQIHWLGETFPHLNTQDPALHEYVLEYRFPPPQNPAEWWRIAVEWAAVNY